MRRSLVPLGMTGPLGMTASYRLRAPRYNILGQGPQRRRGNACRTEVFDRSSGQALGLLPRAVDPEQAHVGRLGELRVAPGGLAQLFAGSRGIEHVVGHLKGEPDIAAERRQCAEPGRIRLRRM